VQSSNEVLLLGGASGVGKTSVAAELHVQLSAARVRHALIEGDNLDLAWPAPWQHGLALAEANLAAMWRTYTQAGYTRLVYSNTAAVRHDVAEALLLALGGDPVVHGVLLTGTTATVTERLVQREIGSALDAHVQRSRRAALELEQDAPAWVRRIATDGRTPTDIAGEIARGLRWSPLPQDL
jgi:gluconate kinase